MLSSTGGTIEDYLTEPALATAKQRVTNKSKRMSSANLVAEHRDYMEQLSLKLRQTNVPEAAVEDMFEECKEVKEARKIADIANREVDEAFQYFQERKQFWDLFK